MNTSWMQRVVLFEYLWAIFNEWGVNTTEKIPVHCIWMCCLDFIYDSNQLAAEQMFESE